MSPPYTKNLKTPVRDKNWKRITQTNAVPWSVRGLKGLLLQNNKDVLIETKVTRTNVRLEWLAMWWTDTLQTTWYPSCLAPIVPRRFCSRSTFRNYIPVFQLHRQMPSILVYFFRPPTSSRHEPSRRQRTGLTMWLRKQSIKKLAISVRSPRTKKPKVWRLCCLKHNHPWRLRTSNRPCLWKTLSGTPLLAAADARTGTSECQRPEGWVQNLAGLRTNDP